MHPVKIRAAARTMVRATTSRGQIDRQRREFLSDAIQPLEPRQLLSVATHHVKLHSTRKPYIPAGQTQPLYSAAPVGLTPAKIRSAYGIGQITFNSGTVVGDGAGQTIAIIDAYDNPSFVSSTDANFANSDLAKFDAAFGIADPPSFRKVNQSGGTSYPTGDTGWGGEIALDVEWAHALAPKANIILVECASSFDSDLFAGVRWAAAQPGVSAVSMSFGGSEFSTQASSDSSFTTPSGHAGVTFVASTGDSGSPGGYPAYSPNVLAVGGTTLSVNTSGAWTAETGWSGSGGGISQYTGKPSYQLSVTQSSTRRTIPDIGFDANPNSGVAVYDSYSQGSAAPWEQVGGTSLSAPCWAALIAITDQGRALRGVGSFSNQQAMSALYALPATDFHDVTSGSNGGFSASAGYDLITGIGSPKANLLVPDLSGQSSSIPAAPSTPDLPTAFDTGKSSTDNLTNINTPTIAGTSAPSAAINVYADGTQVGTGTADGSGNWSVTTSVLSDGTHLITATAGNAAGTSVLSAALSVSIDTVAPQLTGTPAFTYLGSPQKIQYSFDDNLQSTVTTSSLTLVNSTISQTFPAASTMLSWSGNTATYTFVTGYPGNALADGNYTATLNVADLAGNTLVGGPSVMNLFWLTGDANHDRSVDTLDFNALAANFGGTGKNWSQADFNYDGTVDTLDFNALASQFGKSMPADSSSPASIGVAAAATPAAAPASAPASSSPNKKLFSDVTIEKDALDVLA
jgi:subtilase family serine protease